MKTSIVFSRCGQCHSHSDLSLAKDESLDKIKGNNQPNDEKIPSALLGNDYHDVCKAAQEDDDINFKISYVAVSDSSNEICMNNNISLSSVNSLRNFVNESCHSEDKENLLESSESLPSTTGSASGKSTSQDYSPLLSPDNPGVFSFDASECDFETNLWQQISGIDGTYGPETEVLEQSLGKLLDHAVGNIPDRSLYSKSGKHVKDGPAGTHVSKKDNITQLVPIEKSQYPAQVIASIKENTGKKRGRKKIYNAASCLEEEVVLKRARNNEACGKYRTLKRKKLEQLFEEEKALTDDNCRLKALCEQMEAEKVLLTKFISSILKDKSSIHSSAVTNSLYLLHK